MHNVGEVKGQYSLIRKVRLFEVKCDQRKIGIMEKAKFNRSACSWFELAVFFVIISFAVSIAGCHSHRCDVAGQHAFQAAPGTQVAGAQASSVPANAVSFGGHHYLIVKQKLSWQKAQLWCEAKGGQLACIESEAEQQFIAKLAAGKYYYLGATDQVHEGVFVWINGSRFEYTKWYQGQPNNYDGDEHYLATYKRGEWVDVANEGVGFWMPIGFICEWER
jgi:hypothetical protein